MTDEEKAAVKSAGEAENGTPREEPEEEKKLKAAYQALYEAQAAEKAPPKNKSANGTTPETPTDTTTNGTNGTNGTTPAKVDLKTAQRNLQEALQAQGQANLKNNKKNVVEMQKMSKVDKVNWIKRMIKDAEGQLELLEQGLKDFFKSNIAIPAIQDLTKSEEDGKELVRTNYMDADERWADPRR